MAKKIAKYEIPRKDESLDRLSSKMLAHGSLNIDGPDPMWTDIPAILWGKFKAAQEKWAMAYAKCKGEHLPSDTAAKNTAKAELLVTLENLIAHGFLLPPRTAADIVALGFSLIDDSNTPTTEINDTVDIDEITNGPTPGTHVHVVKYRIAGSPSRAKEPYQMAVFRVCVRDKALPPPSVDGDEGWGNDITSMKSPLKRRYDDADDGKIAYYRAHWEAKGGLKGNWAMASAMIP
jgi:hypothetical protein